MQIGEIRIRTIPDDIDIHGANNLRAVAGGSQGASWVELGEYRENLFVPVATLYFNGDDAKAKATRLAAAINQAMQPALAQAAE